MDYGARPRSDPILSTYWLCALWKVVTLSVKYFLICTMGIVIVLISLGCHEHEMSE